MKEAAGEANMTVITIVLIAIVLGVGTVIVNNLMTNTQKRSCCTSLGGEVQGNDCVISRTTTAGIATSSQSMAGNWLKTNCP